MNQLLQYQWGPWIPGTNDSWTHLATTCSTNSTPGEVFFQSNAGRFVNGSVVYPSRDWLLRPLIDEPGRTCLSEPLDETCLEFADSILRLRCFRLLRLGLSETKKPRRVSRTRLLLLRPDCPIYLDKLRSQLRNFSRSLPLPQLLSSDLVELFEGYVLLLHF